MEGNFEVVEWEGGRYLRATSNGLVGIPLPKTLPDRFTIPDPEADPVAGNEGQAVSLSQRP